MKLPLDNDENVKVGGFVLNFITELYRFGFGVSFIMNYFVLFHFIF